MALQRLAAFFQEQHYHHSGRRKPVVLIGPADSGQRCLAVGYEATGRMQVRSGIAAFFLGGGGCVPRPWTCVPAPMAAA